MLGSILAKLIGTYLPTALLRKRLKLKPSPMMLFFFLARYDSFSRRYFPALENNWGYTIMKHTTPEDRSRYHIVSNNDVTLALFPSVRQLCWFSPHLKICGCHSTTTTYRLTKKQRSTEPLLTTMCSLTGFIMCPSIEGSPSL